MDVSWAKELGIDLEALRAEHPLHPVQLRNHKRIARKSAEYWAREKFVTGERKVRKDGRDGFPTDVPGYEWRSITSLANQLWVHPNTIRNWINKGLLPERRDGEKLLRVCQKDLDDLFQPVVTKTPVKTSKVRGYEFTDGQLQIALGVLNAGGAV